jgi:protein tyrosine/serine phosphatase
VNFSNLIVRNLSLLLAALALTGVAQAAPQASTPAQKSMGSRKNYHGLPNFGEVTPKLYRGGQPGADGLEALKKMGVSIVVDMRSSKSDHEQTAVTKLGIKYVSIPWHCPFPRDETFATFLKLMRENADKKVFVHCRLGDDRTGMAIAAYRMGIEGWSADDAMKEMELFGFTGVHHAICPGLASYERGFPKKLKTSAAFADFLPADSAVR